MTNNKKFTLIEVIFAAIVAVFLVLTLVKCNKEEDIKPNTEMQGYIWDETHKKPSMAHVIRHLIGHGIHRRQSGCNCKAPNGKSK